MRRLPGSSQKSQAFDVRIFFNIVFLGLISFLFFGYWFYNLLELVLSMMHELRCRKSLPECGLEAVQ